MGRIVANRGTFNVYQFQCPCGAFVQFEGMNIKLDQIIKCESCARIDYLQKKMQTNKFKVGDVVKCLKDIEFSNGAMHLKDDRILINPITIYYYNHPDNSSNYEKDN